MFSDEQVLASARASLKEPSRPYTPLALDTKLSALNLQPSAIPISSSSSIKQKTKQRSKMISEVYDLSTGGYPSKHIDYLFQHIVFMPSAVQLFYIDV
jgi:hypothetical protein